MRAENRRQWPDWHNGPVPSFGRMDARLLVVGLAPGLKGANRTGRPFTGDYAGDLLYSTLIDFGFARGSYGAAIDDGLELVDCRITNAVRCVPPANKPATEEEKSCLPFLAREIAAMGNLKAVIALGNLAHGAVLKSLKLARSAHPFGHGALYQIPSGLWLAASYHCSRYNTNTGRLNREMFHGVFKAVKSRIGG